MTTEISSNVSLSIGTLRAASVLRAMRVGWRSFLATRPLSVTYAMVFAGIGITILLGIVRASYAPMIFPLVGGFLYVGPILMSGFFALADRLSRSQECSFADLISGFARASREMQYLSLACAFLFILWVLDTAMLYGHLVGSRPSPLFTLVEPDEGILRFLLLSSLLGLLLAFVIFACSAFAVPLLYYRRASLGAAVLLSVRAVFENFGPCMLWAALLALTIISSILLFPLFLLSFPVMAFAGHALYCEVFGHPTNL